MRTNSRLRNSLLCSRMHGKNNGDFRGHRIYCAQQLAELFGPVDIGGAMQSEQAKAAPADAVIQPQISSDGRLLRYRQKVQERVNHQIAHQEDAVSRTPL